MKKQLFLSVILLALSAEMFAPAGRRGGSATPPPPSRGIPSRPGQNTQPTGGSTPSAAQAAQGLTPAEAIASAMEALNVTAAEVAAASPNQAAVNYIQG